MSLPILNSARFVFSLEFRYEAVLLRARFDQNKNVTDVLKAKKILEDGWAELKKNKAAFPFLCNACV